MFPRPECEEEIFVCFVVWGLAGKYCLALEFCTNQCISKSKSTCAGILSSMWANVD
jgi:hypothetical protein